MPVLLFGWALGLRRRSFSEGVRSPATSKKPLEFLLPQIRFPEPEGGVADVEDFLTVDGVPAVF